MERYSAGNALNLRDDRRCFVDRYDSQHFRILPDHRTDPAEADHGADQHSEQICIPAGDQPVSSVHRVLHGRHRRHPDPEPDIDPGDGSHGGIGNTGMPDYDCQSDDRCCYPAGWNCTICNVERGQGIGKPRY